MSVVHSSMLNLSSAYLSKSTNHYSCTFVFPNLIKQNRKIVLQASLENKTESEASTTISVDENNINSYSSSPKLITGAQVVRKFYEGINRHDIASVEPLIADNCVYEDLIFPTPFLGRKSILEFFGKFIDYVSTDLQFVIDAISEEDSLAVGVTWHLEWKGRPFPFSKGCSFYQLAVINDTRQIVYARDSVEPAIKPGESALIAIRGVVWLLQRFPWLAERL